MEETKTCTKCLNTKLLSEFGKNSKGPEGLDWWCKQCKREYSAGYRAGNPQQAIAYRASHREQAANYWLQGRYNITLAEYDEMLEAQGGGCAICGATPEENGKRLGIDHNHKTGEVRELLCKSCNHALGMLQDSPELCRQAMLYLRRHENITGV